MGDKGCLPLMAILDSHIVVSPTNVEFCEDSGISQFVDEIGDEGKGVGVTDSMFVDVAVILARAKSSILLFDEEEGERLWQVGRGNLS